MRARIPLSRESPPPVLAYKSSGVSINELRRKLALLSCARNSISMTNTTSVRKTRKTRIVCISDTHNQTPKLPQGDVLIHAGDL